MASPIEIQPAKKGSLEEILYSSNVKVGLIDFKNLSPISILRNRKIYIRPLGHMEMNSYWSQHLDGVFYISEMIPSRMANES